MMNSIQAGRYLALVQHRTDVTQCTAFGRKGQIKRGGGGGGGGAQSDNDDVVNVVVPGIGVDG